MLSAVTPAIKYSGVTTSAKTHLMRKAGVRLAEARDCPIEEIRRHGKWNDRTVMESVYLTEVSKPAVRALAGFKPEGTNDYHLPRCVPAPDELAAQIFPFIDKW